jgi:hypothetical protein
MNLMRCHTTFLSSAMLYLGLTVISGCGDGTPSIDTSLNEATVSGVVMVKGVPATGGTVLFNPSNSGRKVPSRTAPIGTDGSYTIKTLTGTNQVSFEGEVAGKNRGVGLIKEFAEVASGKNKKDFDLMGEGGGKKLIYPVDSQGPGTRGSKRAGSK